MVLLTVPGGLGGAEAPQGPYMHRAISPAQNKPVQTVSVKKVNHYPKYTDRIQPKHQWQRNLKSLWNSSS